MSERRLRIGIALSRLGFAGGLEKYAFDLATHLQVRGHSLTLLHGSEKGQDEANFVTPFAHVRALAHTADPRELDVVYVQRAASVDELRSFGDVPLAVASHDHDLSCVRRHRYLPLTLEPCHRAPGIACISHGCCIVKAPADSRLPIAVQSPYALRARLAKLAARAPIICCSQYIADQLVAAGAPKGRVHAVHPTPPEDATPTVARPTTRSLAIAGQLVRGKGVDIAIEALAYLPDDTTLTVVGDGPSRRELERLADATARGRVHFAGYLSPERVREIYDAANVVVVPSRWPEPFGMIGIEAMRRERPVVAARHGGIPEWLGEPFGGRSFEPGSARDLANALRAVMADRDAGARGAEHARTRFPHARFVERIEALLRQIAS